MKKDTDQTDDEFVADEEVVMEEGLTDKIKELRARLKVCEQEKSEFLAGWQRSKADYVNLKKEAHEHQTKLLQSAKTDVLLEFLSIADNFDLAFSHKESWKRLPEDWRLGIEQIHKQLIKIFHHHHLEVIDPIGEAFNPTLHHSVGEEEVIDLAQDDKVVAVIKKGYKLGDKIIRPAEVKVGVLN